MKEINLLVVGAVISLVATVIGYLAQSIVQLILNNRGNVNVYVKSVYNKISHSAWGFSGNDTFDVPLWIEIHNTKNKNVVLRNMNLQLYDKGKKVGKTIQISHVGREIPYGSNGAYSFLVEPCSISRYDLNFRIKKSDINCDFDEVRISYFDSKDVYREYKLFDIENCWENSNNKIDDDWHLLV